MEFKTEKELLLYAVKRAEQLKLVGDMTDLVEKVANGEYVDNQYILDLATHAYLNADFNNTVQSVYESMDIATAKGEQLDNLGRLFNVNRLPGIPAMIELELSLELPESNDITIPVDTIVEIDELQVDPYITYTTDSQVTIKAGSTTASVTCSSDYHALQRKVPAETVKGLKGFPTVTAYNREEGTSGRNIENDDEYRQRILLWSVKNTTGTQEAFKAYLGEVQGLDDYKLIPRPEGQVGYLIVVCDCDERRLEEIQAGIQENCMLFTDDPCYCVNPVPRNIDINITANITREPIQHTVSEIIELIRHEAEVYINGGATRVGNVISGKRIGETFIPSQLVMHLHNVFPELLSIEITNYNIIDDEGNTVEITDYDKLQCRVVEVSIT